MEVFLGGIYCIKNISNNKVYIGLSSNVLKRVKFQFKTLDKNKHKNKHLQFSYNKYGKDIFISYILEYCSNELLCEKEKYYIDLFQSYQKEYGFNKTLGGEFGVVSDEINQKRILKLKQLKPSEEIKNRIRNTLLGYKQTEESIKKRVKAIRKCSDEIEKNIIDSYLIENKNRTELAEIYNIKRTTVCSILKRHNIKRINLI